MAKKKETPEQAIAKIKKRYPNHTKHEILSLKEKGFMVALYDPIIRISKLIKYTFYGDKIEDLKTDAQQTFDQFIKSNK